MLKDMYRCKLCTNELMLEYVTRNGQEVYVCTQKGCSGKMIKEEEYDFSDVGWLIEACFKAKKMWVEFLKSSKGVE